MFRVWRSGSRVWGTGSGVQGQGFRRAKVEGLVLGFYRGFRDEGLVLGLRLKGWFWG